MRWVTLCCGLFFCVFIAPDVIAHAEEGGGKGKGLLSEVVEGVDSTVSESVGGVVDSAVEGVNETVNDTASFTGVTVDTLTESSKEQLASKVVNQTVELVGKTTDNVVPVVEVSKETVRKAASGFTVNLNKLPKIPVVKPVLDEVGQVVNQTTKPVKEAVNEVGDSFDLVNENEPSVDLQNNNAPSRDAQPDAIEKTEVVSDDDQLSTNDSLKALEFIEPLIDEGFGFDSNKAPFQTAVSTVNETVNVAKVEGPVDQEATAPAVPIRSNAMWDGIPLAVTTTGATGNGSPVVGHVGNFDVLPGIVEVLALQHDLSGRQWVHSDEHMRIQWVHAPPGQPPQFSPFLQTKK